jgi:uncharacterized membrane protein YgaE (UPF0421/DUF939 family)
MDKEKIIEIVSEVENKSNKDLTQVVNFLHEEFYKTKNLIIDLTRHLDTVEEMYNKANNELEKRNIK